MYNISKIRNISNTGRTVRISGYGKLPPQTETNKREGLHRP